MKSVLSLSQGAYGVSCRARVLTLRHNCDDSPPQPLGCTGSPAPGPHGDKDSARTGVKVSGPLARCITWEGLQGLLPTSRPLAWSHAMRPVLAVQQLGDLHRQAHRACDAGRLQCCRSAPPRMRLCRGGNRLRRTPMQLPRARLSRLSRRTHPRQPVTTAFDLSLHRSLTATVLLIRTSKGPNDHVLWRTWWCRTGVRIVEISGELER